MVLSFFYACAKMIKEAMVTEEIYIIRKSLILFVIRLVLIEVLFELIYLGWRFGIDLLPLADSTKLSFHFITSTLFIIITFFQILSLILLVSRWINNYYEVQHDELIVWTGFWGRKGKSYQYANIQSITVEQGFFARLCGYGNVRVYIPAFGQDIIFSEVPKPYAFIELIKQRMPKASNQQIVFRQR